MVVSMACNYTLFSKYSALAAICIFTVRKQGSANTWLAVSLSLPVTLIALDIATHSLQQRIEPNSSIPVVIGTAIGAYEQTITVGIVVHWKHRHAVHVFYWIIPASTQLTDEAGHYMEAPSSPLSKCTKDHVVRV